MNHSELSVHVFFCKSFLPESSVDLKAKIFTLWQNEWTSIYSNQHSDHRPSADGFFRYDVVVGLFRKDEPVGMSAHTFFDAADRAGREVEFFQNYSGDFLSRLSRNGTNHLMTYESLLVARHLRFRERDLPIGSILGRLGVLVFLESNANALVGIVRNDNNAAKLADLVGFQRVERNLPCRNFPCDAIAMQKEEALTLPAPVEGFVSELWERRIVHFGSLPMSPQISLPRLRVA